LTSLSFPRPPPPSSTLFPYTTLFRSDPGLAIVTPARSPTVADAPGAERVAPPDNQDHVVGQVTSAVVEHARKRSHGPVARIDRGDRKSTRLNSSHLGISYAVFCLKKK